MGSTAHVVLLGRPSEGREGDILLVPVLVADIFWDSTCGLSLHLIYYTSLNEFELFFQSTCVGF